MVDTYYPAFLAEHYGAGRGCGTPRTTSSSLRSWTAASAPRTRTRVDLRELGHDAADVVVNCVAAAGAWAREHGRTSAAAAGAAHCPRASACARAAAPRTTSPQRADRRVRPRRRLPPGPVVLQPRRARRASAQPGAWSSARSRARRRGRAAARLRPDHHLVPALRRALPRRSASTASTCRSRFDERVLDRLREAGIDPAPAAERPHAAVVRRRRWTRACTRRGTALLERLAARGADRGLGLRRATSCRAARRCSRATAARRGGSTCTRVLRARRASSLNRHIEAAEGYANNMRLFETTGVGALLVTEAAPNLADLFEPGDARSSPTRARTTSSTKIEHYLEHEDERAAIAAAGQARTLREHTYARRIARAGRDARERASQTDDARVLHALRLELPVQGGRPCTARSCATAPTSG